MKKYLFIVAMILSAGCVKDSWKKVIDQSKRVTNLWEIVSLTEKDLITGNTIDSFALMPTCQKDNVINFGEYGDYYYSEYRNLCTPANTEKGEWKFQNHFADNVDVSIIDLKSNGIDYKLLITKLDDQSFEFEKQQVGTTVKLVYACKRVR
jgi:hypothetical protein